MKAIITAILALEIVGVAAAYDLGNQAPVKPVVTYPENVPNPERQGGDTISRPRPSSPACPTATAGLPPAATTTTTRSARIRTATRPMSSIKSRRLTATIVSIDLCGSSYDTKVYVYDSSLQVVACNDDFYYGPPCGEYTSHIECATFTGGETYYIIVDGYGSASGQYFISLSDRVGCHLDLPGQRLDRRRAPWGTTTSTITTEAAIRRRPTRSNTSPARSRAPHSRPAAPSSAAGAAGTCATARTIAIPTGSP